MAKEAKGKLRLKAIDSMSKVIDNVTRKTRSMKNGLTKASIKMKLLQARSRGLTKSLAKVGNKMKNAGKTMTTFLTAPVVAFGALALKSATNFQASMNAVAARTGATGKALESMTKKAKELGSSTQFSASQAADAMAFFGQAGFNTNEILAATPATLSLAAASATDLATSADILSNVMGGFNVKADQAGKFADVLALATAKGNINMSQLGETMSKAAPLAQKAGAEIEEVAALTAKLGDAGIQGSRAGTVLGNMFTKLSAPTTRISKIMGALGVKTVDPATGKLRSMTVIMQELGKSFEAKGIKGAKKLAILNEIFGKQAVAGSAILLDAAGKIDATTGINTISTLTNKLIGAKGAADKMAKTMQKGLPGAFKSLGSAFEGVQLAILDLDFGGKKLSVRIAEIVGKVTKFLQSLSTTNKGLLKTIVVIASVVAIIGPLLLAFGTVLTILPLMVQGFGLFVIALKFVGGAFLLIAKLGPIILFILKGIGIGISLLLSPIGLVVLAIAGLINLFLRFDKIKAGFQKGIGAGIKTFFGFGDESAPAGPKVDQPNGKEINARGAIKESEDKKNRDKKALLDVNFSNMPQGSRVSVVDESNILESLTGTMAGGI